MTPARQGAAEAAESARLPPTPWSAAEPAPESFPGALWLTAFAIRKAWKVRGTVFCDDTFVSDGAMILRRDLIRGPLPDWLEHSIATDGVRPSRAEIEARWGAAVDSVDTVLRDPQMSNPIPGGSMVRYDLEGGGETFFAGERLWLARAATGARQLWTSNKTGRQPVVAGRGRTPTAAIMPLKLSSCEDFEPWGEA